jgi:predicted ATPase with chaperone activity
MEDVAALEFDLPFALAVLLSDPSHAHMRRSGWIAWGALGLDGSLAPAEGALLNDLPPGPCAGRIWAPDDHIPAPDEDAVISLVDVMTLTQAWEVLVFFAEAEEVILDGASAESRDKSPTEALGMTKPHGN